ncbi:MAG: GtrA family protein [Candidatus Nomurabacteria bacterium]|nr:GtrA family protein [Candidatus Nomurabacteria bacterium]
MNLKSVLKVVRFLVSGGIGVIFGFITLYSLTEYVGLWYILSAAITFVLSDVLGFILKKIWVFEDKNIKVIQKQIFLYIILSITYLITNTGLLYVLVEYLQIQYIISQIILTSILSFPSYFISRYIFIAQKAQ